MQKVFSQSKKGLWHLKVHKAIKNLRAQLKPSIINVNFFRVPFNIWKARLFFYWKGPEFRAPGALWALTTPEKILGALRAPEALINKNLFYDRTGPTLRPRYLSFNKINREMKIK